MFADSAVPVHDLDAGGGSGIDGRFLALCPFMLRTPRCQSPLTCFQARVPRLPSISAAGHGWVCACGVKSARTKKELAFSEDRQQQFESCWLCRRGAVVRNALCKCKSVEMGAHTRHQRPSVLPQHSCACFTSDRSQQCLTPGALCMVRRLARAAPVPHELGRLFCKWHDGCIEV